MKKSLFFVVLLALIAGTAQAQWLDMRNNQRAAIGLNIGAVGYGLTGNGINTQYNGLGIGFNFSIGGVYIDFIRQWPEHQYEHTVYDPTNPINGWYDHTALAINVGYQIPVLPFLFVTPLVGYSNETDGFTKMGSVHVDQESHELVHDYEVLQRYNHFNYGLGVSTRLFDCIEFGVVATNHALYGTLSYSVMASDK